MRTCSVDGCEKAHRARGLCSSHYNQQHQPDRHRKVTIACGYCGEPCEKDRTDKFAARFCSLVCRDLARLERPYSPRAVTRCTVPPSHPARWFGMTCPVSYKHCAICGRLMVIGARRVYCSRTCYRRSCDMRRRGRRSIRRIDVFLRDGWICWLCGGACDERALVPHPLAATVDHLVPRCRGGTDHADNLGTAHFICNSIRGDREGVTHLPVAHAA